MNEARPTKSGWIEVVVGPMYSGKTEELIRRLRRAQIARQRVEIFKPAIDDRYAKDAIVSHSEVRVPSPRSTGRAAGAAATWAAGPIRWPHTTETIMASRKPLVAALVAVLAAA